MSTTLYISPQALLNPLTPMISLAILLTVSHTVLVMLVWRIGIRSTYNPLTDICIFFILITCLLDIVLILLGERLLFYNYLNYSLPARIMDWGP